MGTEEEMRQACPHMAPGLWVRVLQEGAGCHAVPTDPNPFFSPPHPPWVGGCGAVVLHMQPPVHCLYCQVRGGARWGCPVFLADFR